MPKSCGNTKSGCAKRSETTTGILILESRPDDLLIWSVATAPDARRSGIGNELLAAAESRARELPKCVIRLYTGELLVDNIAWYQRRGYAIERLEALSDRRIVHMIENTRGRVKWQDALKERSHF